jgi:endonuclease/exonuclease/phosphatase (EEP) superfamily protein YafD
VVAAALMTAARWVDVPLRPLVLVQSLSPLAGPVSLVALAAAVLPGRRAADSASPRFPRHHRPRLQCRWSATRSRACRTATVSCCGGVHAFPPVPGRLRQWRTSFHELTRWVHRTRGPVVLAGDFNASVDHPGMRELLAGGLRDAHEAAGAGRPPTWPHGRWVPAFVQLDHVLVRGVDVDSADETRIPGTDHDAVVVDLVVPVQTRSRS